MHCTRPIPGFPQAADDDGQGMVEYSLLIALIAMALVGGMSGFGNVLGSFYDTINVLVGALQAQ